MARREGKAPGSYNRIYSGVYGDRRFKAAGLTAVGLWAVCLAWASEWCEDDEGTIPREVVKEIGGHNWLRSVSKLTQNGLWIPSRTGYQFVNYPQYAVTRSEREEQRTRWLQSKKRRRGVDNVPRASSRIEGEGELNPPKSPRTGGRGESLSDQWARIDAQREAGVFETVKA